MPGFQSDNTSPAHPMALLAIDDINWGEAPAYGDDSVTADLQSTLSILFGRQAFGLPVATGTAANCIALRALSPSYGNVYCHTASHIVVDECGAPTFFNPGMKLVCIDGLDGRINLEDLVVSHGHTIPGLFHGYPAAVSLSQCTERGVVYTLDELSKISSFCKTNGLYLHIDGARLGNALASLRATPAELIDACEPDTLAFGLTKTGGAMAEVIVTFDEARFDAVTRIAKQSGHLLSKQRFLSAQISGLLASDRWLDCAAHANQKAREIGEHFHHRLILPVQANQVFIATTPADEEALLEADISFLRWPVGDRRGCRLVTSWMTSSEDIAKLLRTIE